MMRDMPLPSTTRAVRVLAATDPQFAGLVRTLYGPSAGPDQVIAELVGKSSPGVSDVHVPAPMSNAERKRRERLEARIGLVTNTGAIAAGSVAAVGAYKRRRLIARANPEQIAAIKPGVVARTASQHVPLIRRLPKRQLLMGAALGEAAFQVGDVAGDLVARRVLHRAAVDDAPKPKPKPPAVAVVHKSVLTDLVRGYLKQTKQVVRHVAPGLSTRVERAYGAAKAPVTGVHPQQMSLLDEAGQIPNPTTAPTAKPGKPNPGLSPGARAGQLWNAATKTPERRAALWTGGALATAVGVHHVRANHRQQVVPPLPTAYYSKGYEQVEVEWTGTIAKLAPEKQMAFGWANVSKINGQLVLDRQDDIVLPEDIEDAVYAYNMRSRVGGDMHRRTPDGQPVKIGELVESMMFTPEKKAALGLPDDFPEGWWVGFHYPDPQVWADVKVNKRGFSIHGRGLRKSVDYDQLMGA